MDCQRGKFSPPAPSTPWDDARDPSIPVSCKSPRNLVVNIDTYSKKMELLSTLLNEDESEKVTQDSRCSTGASVEKSDTYAKVFSSYLRSEVAQF